MQETQSLAAVCFKLALADHSDVVANVNPMSKALGILSTVQSGPDLAKVQVTNADGTQQSLVPAGQDTDGAASSIMQFVKINSSVPADGSRQRPTAARHAAAARAPGLTVPPLWGVSFTNGRLKYHEGPDTPAQLGLRALPSTAPGPLAAGDDWIEVASGDFFAWLTDAFDDVEKFFVTVIDDIHHFVVTIAGEIYHVLLDCIAAVVHAVEFIFNKIKVFFEDLIKWLGFLFQWPDIVRTHRVMKNILNQYIANCIANLDDLKGDVQTAFTDAETYIANWAGIPPNIPPSLSDSTKSGTAGSNPPPSGLDSPQSNWGVHHLKSNAASAGMSTNGGVPPDGDILQPLIDAIDREKDVIESAFDSFKTDIIDKFDQLSFEQVVEAAIAIILDALLESVENVLLAAIDVLAELTEGIIEALNATIDIPIISWIYKEVSGDDLSLLDVACLVAAIPVTIVYKLITETAPFPDNATTQSLIDAPDFETIRRICNPASAPAPKGTQPQPVAATADIDPGLNKQLGLAGGILSLFGAICCSILGPLKLKFKDSAGILGIISALNGVCYLTYVAPDIMGDIPDVENPKWWADTNTALAGVMVVKAGVDVATTTKAGAWQSAFMEGWNNASPWVDFGANIVWQVPTTAAIIDQENWNTIGILNFWGGTCFDGNGIMSPVLADDSDPVTWTAAVVIAAILNGAYGAMSCAASALAYEKP